MGMPVCPNTHPSLWCLPDHPHLPSGSSSGRALTLLHSGAQNTGLVCSHLGLVTVMVVLQLGLRLDSWAGAAAMAIAAIRLGWG